MARRIKLGFVTVLTAARFPLVLAFFACALLNAREPRPWLFLLGFALLVSSAVTDLFDGYFARRFSVQTSLGAHMDPLMDKFFYLSTLPLLVFLALHNGHLKHAVSLLVLTLLFLTRDQWVTFLRAIGSMYNVSGAANWAGKLRTAVNFPLICAIYHVEASPWQIIPPMLLYVFEGIALVVTLVSLWTYTSRYWPCLVKAADLDDDANTSENQPEEEPSV